MSRNSILFILEHNNLQHASQILFSLEKLLRTCILFVYTFFANFWSFACTCNVERRVCETMSSKKSVISFPNFTYMPHIRQNHTTFLYTIAARVAVKLNKSIFGAVNQRSLRFEKILKKSTPFLPAFTITFNNQTTIFKLLL